MTTKENVDISSLIPLRMYSSIHYLPFWLLTISKFLLFLTHNMIGALATTLFGSNGAYAMMTMYIFFIGGNFLAPLMMRLSNQNTGLMMFSTSLIYTAFAFISTFIVFVQTSTSNSPLITTNIAHWIFYTISAITGIAGGCIWIGYGVLNIDLGESISAKILNDYLSQHLLAPSISRESAANLLREAITAKIMSVGWSVLSLNTVIGGILTFAILVSGSTSLPDSSITPELAKNGTKYQLLFIIFSIISICANISYYALYKLHSHELYFKSTPSPPSSHTLLEDIEAALNIDTSSPILHKEHEETKSLLSSTTLSNKYGTSQDNIDSVLSENIPSHKMMSQWQLFIDLIKTPYVLLSLLQYVFAGAAFNFVFASYAPNTVKNTLGIDKIALLVVIAYTFNTVISFFIGGLISTHLRARLACLLGTIIQILVPFIPMLFVPAPFSIGAWLSMVVIAMAAGVGDAIASSALMTCMSSDLRVDLSLCGQRYAGKDELFPDIKSIVYSIYSATKSVGVFVVFLLSGTFEYETQCQTIIFLGISSLCVQFVLYQRLQKTLHFQVL